MGRPLRIEFPGAVYHVTSRGDRREPIFADDEDRLRLLDILGQAMERFDAQGDVPFPVERGCVTAPCWDATLP